MSEELWMQLLQSPASLDQMNMVHGSWAMDNGSRSLAHPDCPEFECVNKVVSESAGRGGLGAVFQRSRLVPRDLWSEEEAECGRGEAGRPNRTRWQ
jgi:hypothetical protein